METKHTIQCGQNGGKSETDLLRRTEQSNKPDTSLNVKHLEPI